MEILDPSLKIYQYKLHKMNDETKKYSVADLGFSWGGAPTPKVGLFFQLFAENCMKMKEFGPRGGGARVPGAPPWIRQCYLSI